MASVGWRIFGREPGDPADGKEKPLSGVFTTGYETAKQYAEEQLRPRGYVVTGIRWTGGQRPKDGRS